MKYDRRIWILLSIVFIDMLGFGLVVPIFPLMIKEMGGSPFIVGLTIATYSLFQFISSPILGRLSDKYGRKPVLVISSFINALSYLILVFSSDIAHIFIARILGGIASGNMAVGQAYIADVSKSHERTKLMALFGSLFGIGFAIGPFAGGILSSGNYSGLPFIITAILSFISFALLLAFVPESNKNLQKHIKIEFFNAQLTKEVIQPRNMKFLFVLFFLINFASSLTFGIFPLFSNALFSWGQRENGYFFGLGGLVSFIGQGFLVAHLLKLSHEKMLIKIGILIYGASILLLGLSVNIAELIISTIFINLGFSLINPNIQGLASLETKEDEQGIVMGVLQSFGSFARIAGPIIGGVLATYKINLPYFISALLIFLIFIWGRKYLKERKSHLQHTPALEVQ